MGLPSAPRLPKHPAGFSGLQPLMTRPCTGRLRARPPSGPRHAERRAPRWQTGMPKRSHSRHSRHSRHARSWWTPATTGSTATSSQPSTPRCFPDPRLLGTDVPAWQPSGLLFAATCHALCRRSASCLMRSHGQLTQGIEAAPCEHPSMAAARKGPVRAAQQACRWAVRSAHGRASLAGCCAAGAASR